MLEIDFSLVPMSEADRQMVRGEVARRVEQGDIPPPERSVNGRVVLLNPDPVQTIHQVSDDLRPRLRRIMMPAQEGSTHLSADRLFHAIADSDERLYLIIIELQSEFRYFSDFLNYLPRLRKDFPEMSVFLSGSLPHLREKVHQVLSEGGASLVMEYPDGRNPDEFTDPEEFLKRVSTTEEIVSLSIPFFTEIRLVLDSSGRAIPMNLLTLRKLQPVLGFGEPQEVEVGKGRRERMIIVDLPLQIIQDFRFRQDRGLDFLGIVMNGTSIPSRQFGEEKLEFRWVPMKAIEGILRRNSMGEQEKVDLKQIGVMRVNTLTGEISFVKKEQSEQVSLDQPERLGFRKKLSGKAAQGIEIPENEVGGLLIPFDRIIQPSTTSALRDPMQEAVKDHFYGKLIGEKVEQNRKVELYAQRLKVAGVGPLAAQTLKLLRRFGLERVIHEDSFFYMCDTPEEIPTHHQTPERYQEHFGGLIQVMRDLAFGQPSEQIRVSDIAYNLPISTEWVDTGLASFPKVTNQELEAVYHEMHMLQNFIAHEFRRNFDIQQEDVVFFQKIQHCREAGLLSKWLSEFKRGAYGKMLPEGTHPDVLFFATEEDQKENNNRYFFPSLSCMELFKGLKTKELFQKFDYDFSVFLEEQLALAIHHAREDGVMQPKAEDFEGYFKQRIEEVKKELGELNDALDAIDDAGSPIYQKMLKEEEETYHDRYREFQTDQERVEQQLTVAAGKVDSLVGELKGELHRGEMPEDEFYAEDPEYPEALETRLLDAAQRTGDRHQMELQSRFSAMTGIVAGWLKSLEEFSGYLRRFHQVHIAWQAAKEQVHTSGMAGRWEGKLTGRFDHLKRMKAIEREHHAKRVEAQLLNYQGEIEQIDSRIGQHGQKIQRSLVTLKHYMAHAGVRIKALSKSDTIGDPDKVVGQAETLCKTLVEISKNAQTLAERSQGLQDDLEKTRLGKLRNLDHYYQLQVEDSVLKAVQSGSEPALPAPPGSGATPPGEGEAERLKDTWNAHGKKLESSRSDLGRAVKSVDEALNGLKGQTARYHRFKEKHEALIRLQARKKRLRESATGLAERKEMMDGELADLPNRVKKFFMPARKKLLVEIFIPEVERKIAMFDQARTFLIELLGLSFEWLQTKYLDHSIYRRFHARQFLRGGAYASDPASPLHHAMRNVQPALRLMLRAYIHNYKRHNKRGVERLAIPQLSFQSSREIMASIERMAKSDSPRQFDYLVLPPTLPLMEGLNMMARKDEWFNGIPQLVLVFITKFDGNLLRRDATVRDAYFKALKHNVVLNVDGHVIVDNPRAIGMRLLQETLGCSIDIPDVQEPLEVASADVD